MKSIVILLLLLLFFVSGMMFGVDRDHSQNTSPEVQTIDVNESEIQQEQAETVVKTSAGKDNIGSENGEYKQAPTHFTQKMASFIEGIVKGFYEVIIQLLYQVVQLFY